MNTQTPTRHPLAWLCALGAALLLGACAAPPKTPALTVAGSARFEAATALPPNALLEVSVVDVSRADGHAFPLARSVGPASGTQPLRFSLPVDGRQVQERGSYSVRAEVLVDGKALFVTDRAYLVLGHSGTTTADVVLRPVDTRAAAVGQKIENVRWVLVSLDGQPLPPTPGSMPHFTLNTSGLRVTVFGGCNELAGTYRLNGQALEMLRGPRRQLQVCAQDMERERAFLFALATTEQWTMDGQRLRLLDRLGAQVALLEARPAP
ncbi:YbaY family lipoprotein [Hydrogenophaga sp.]|uniref:YbaY family lipoprotein n=1 Tax=Hydrogenophaga sp. TaxID=1904254 RepID=UPI0027310E8E|nr:YbaY family lipoprotein [Hydrogenophaga sp.]MDP1687149.1 YbaY family lipoprotein [Hydrogenophaga sp.]